MRYLEKLVLPLEAAHTLVCRVAKFWKYPPMPTLSLYRIEMTPAAPNITSGHVDAFKARFIASLDVPTDQNAARAYLTMREADGRLNVETLNQYMSIHAEVALMTLAFAAAQGEASDVVDVRGWKDAMEVARAILPVSTHGVLPFDWLLIVFVAAERDDHWPQ